MQHDEAIKIFDRYLGLPTDVRRAFNRILDDHNIERTGRIELIAERDQLRAELAAAKNLLARIHRDGGHHTEAVGFAQSVADAGDKVSEWLLAADERDALAADNARLRDLLDSFAYWGARFGVFAGTKWVDEQRLSQEAHWINVYAKDAKEALAATPAQSLAAHDAALLRKIATKFRGDLAKYWDGTYGAAALHLEAEADRIEQEAPPCLT